MRNNNALVLLRNGSAYLVDDDMALYGEHNIGQVPAPGGLQSGVQQRGKWGRG